MKDIRCQSGETFSIDLHLFDFSQPCLRYFIWAFMQLMKEGLGSGRWRVKLESVTRIDQNGSLSEVVFDGQDIRPDAEHTTLSISLAQPTNLVDRLMIIFHTPTLLKQRGEILNEPYFPAIAVRARDRIESMRSIYQSAASAEDEFREYAVRARSIRMVAAQIQQVEATRRSTRTGIKQKLAGFLGFAEFEGDLTEFVPYLLAAYWTGVGRETVWGHGAIQAIPLPIASSQLFKLLREQRGP